MIVALAATAPSLARSMQLTLSPFRYGSRDPTTRLTSREFVRATLTPDGPGTLRIVWGTDRAGIGAEAWGDGAAWLLERARGYTGGGDVAVDLPDVHPLVTRAARDHPGLRIGASGGLYHELLPTIIAQRITSGEAARQWGRLCLALGEPAPGPFPGLRLPPSPKALARRPAWWFHPLGIETKRARALTAVAAHARHLWEWAGAGPAHTAARLALVRGVGPWTIGSVSGPALGDPDAVAVGDYHLANMVGWAMAGEPRATDDRMLELLEPFRGQRGRVIRLIGLAGSRVPAFGPRKRILPMHRW
ncbi:MAG: DNA-3-methyladenine glycosylase family protein [Ilumatobacteraceae bacterium]